MSEHVALPLVLAEFAEVAGLGAALQIAREKGGTEVYFPKPENLSDKHWLVEAVGKDAALKLAERFGGGHCEIPLGPQGGNRGKIWMAISQGLSEGKSATDVALTVGVHHRTVRRHKNGHSGRPRENENQFDMFQKCEGTKK